MQILLIDFDVFSTRGGGQTFYRRVIDRHPKDLFFYPSRGPDLRRSASLPPNARPFAVDAIGDDEFVQKLPGEGLTWSAYGHVLLVASLGRPLQGRAFDVVEVPSYRACASFIRPVLAAYGILVGRISLSMLGWLSTSLSKADANWQGLAEIRQDESEALAAADVCYTISTLHAAENTGRAGPVGIVEMRDALEVIPVPEPLPPGEGPPNLWYVGRLDLAKGPDLFLAIAARMDRSSYGTLRLAGPDNDWEPEGGRWSDHLRELAAQLGLDIRIDLALSDEDLRAEVYGGRSVIVIPSRTDSFNLVALEALAHGAPILLSRHTGAAGFLAENHPQIVPPIIEPEDIDASAEALAALLHGYPARAAALRADLREYPLANPRQDFLHAFWCDAAPAPEAPTDPAMYHRLQQVEALDTSATKAWRPSPRLAGRLTAVVIVRDAAEALRRTLASLVRQGGALAEILVVDDGSSPSLPDLGNGIRLLRQGRRGLAAACNRAAFEATGMHVLFLLAGDVIGLDAAATVGEAALGMEGRTDAMSLHGGWLPASKSEPNSPEALAGRDARALLCARQPLVEAGGFAASDNGAALLVPPGLRFAIGPRYAAPLVWRQQEAAKPWRTAVRDMLPPTGQEISSPDEAISKRNVA